jgi:Ran GTPase-activating protein (RanGAP) involved in mRNA processing and transport
MWKLCGGKRTKNRVVVEERPAVQVGPVAMERWLNHGGAELDAVLASGAVLLLDAEWVVGLAKRGGVLSPRQSLPQEAFLSQAEVQTAAAIVAVSHCWLQPDHPDPRGHNLRLLARALQLRLQHSPGCRLGVFYDFSCIFQKCRTADGTPRGNVIGYAAGDVGAIGRRPEEESLFREALGSLGVLYSLPRTFVFMIRSFPPDYDNPSMYARSGNLAPYSDRGWCFCESSWAGMVKNKDMVLDLTNESNDSSSGRVDEATGGTCLPWDAYVAKCRQGRSAPLTPDAFAARLEEKSFTNGSTDRPRVADLYRRCFQKRFGTATWLGYNSLGWGAAEARAVAAVLASGATPALSELSLQFNSLGDDGAQALAAALPHARALAHLRLGNNQIGDAGAVALAAALPATALQELRLSANTIGAAGAAALLKALPAVPTLARLHLHENLLGNKGAIALAAALGSAPGLQHVWLKKNGIGDAGARALAEALPASSGLQTLDLEDNAIGDTAAAALAAALPATTALVALNLGCNSVGEEGAWALVRAAPHAPRLRELLLHSNPIGDETASQAMRKACADSRVGLGL